MIETQPMSDQITTLSPTTPFGPNDFAAASGANAEAMARLRTYANLLTEWNAHTNLVAASTLDDIWRRHFWDSAQLLPLIPESAKTIIDVGSGAGFPGLVLSILLQARPGTTIHLVEATQKKCRFLSEVSGACGVKVEIHWDRAENLVNLKADVVTARAVSPLDKLFGQIEQCLAPDALALLLKGARANEELTFARRAWDFAVKNIPSRSDSTGIVLCVTGLRRCPKQTKRS